MAVTAQRLTYARRLSTAVVLLGLAACAACSSTGPHQRLPAVPAPMAVSAAADASDDWHALVLVPFGVLLKESPIPLHEVLLFHDEERPVAELDNKDCYAIEGAPPRFLRQLPDQYLLCFSHDHLSRIEASVRLAAVDAPQAFARACALWLKNPSASVGPGTTCEGRDGGVAFSARLGLATDERAASVSMTLTNAPPHEAVDDAAPARDRAQ